MSTTRRDFLRNSSAVLAGAGLAGLAAPLPAAPRRRAAPSDRIRVALIGARNMGFGDLSNALGQPDVECAAICDVDAHILRQRRAEVEKRQGKAPEGYGDFRKLLERRDIDAVIIGTPDHWHCLTTVYACQAGKDVYVEKPLANSIDECALMVKAARRYGRVVQVGQQQRSGAHWQQAMTFMKEGKIGQLRKVLVWGNFGYGIGAPKVPDAPVPEGVDYDFWLGPAPQRSFNPSRFHGNWRMFWDYGGGLMTDWGVHLLDMALWVKDVRTPPLSVMSTGGNWAYPDHAHETFDTLTVNYQLPDYTITWQHTAGTDQGPYGRSYGLAYIGNDATLVIDRAGWELLPETRGGKPAVPRMPKHPGHDSHAEHMRNFLDCIKSRKDPHCTVENGALVASYAHMGNLSLRAGAALHWDDKRKDFGEKHPANALLRPAYRRPWSWPSI